MRRLTWLLRCLVILGLLGLELVASCPEKCVCRSSTVDCSNQGLTAFPSDVPRDTVKL